MIRLWNHVLQIGRAHGVDPVVFAVLYLIHHPLFWGTFAVVISRARLRRPYKPLAALAAFFWLMPYLYVFFFGHGLPWWLYVLVVLALAVAARQGILEIRKRLRHGMP